METLNLAMIDVLTERFKLHNKPKTAMRYFMIVFNLLQNEPSLAIKVLRLHLDLFESVLKSYSQQQTGSGSIGSDVVMSLFHEYLRVISWVI